MWNGNSNVIYDKEIVCLLPHIYGLKMKTVLRSLEAAWCQRVWIYWVKIILSWYYYSSWSKLGKTDRYANTSSCVDSEGIRSDNTAFVSCRVWGAPDEEGDYKDVSHSGGGHWGRVFQHHPGERQSHYGCAVFITYWYEQYPPGNARDALWGDHLEIHGRKYLLPRLMEWPLLCMTPLFSRKKCQVSRSRYNFIHQFKVEIHIGGFLWPPCR